jgi:hypothetical protein
MTSNNQAMQKASERDDMQKLQSKQGEQHWVALQYNEIVK